MKKTILYSLAILCYAFTANSQNTITSVGLTYSPELLVVNEGETVTFQLASNHNAVEISKSTWLANGSQGNGGFNIPFGGGTWTAAGTDTLYYVCTPHASAGMKGRIVVIQGLNSNIEQKEQIRVFPNPFRESANFVFPTILANASSRLIDVSGRLVLETPLSELQQKISTLPSGIYYLKVSDLPSIKLIKSEGAQ
jgi:plastocyanin